METNVLLTPSCISKLSSQLQDNRSKRAAAAGDGVHMLASSKQGPNILKAPLRNETNCVSESKDEEPSLLVKVCKNFIVKFWLLKLIMY